MVPTADAIIIGAGHNGLVAACYLARAGLDVVVLEAASTIGGMTATATPIASAPDHRIYSCAVDMVFTRLSGVVDDLDLRRFGYRDVPVDPCYAYLHDEGASIALWLNDVQRTADEIAHFSGADAEAYLRLMGHLDAAMDMTQPFMTVNPIRPGARALARSGRAVVRHRAKLKKLPSLFIDPAAQTIDAYFHHPVVRDFMATVAGAIGGPITTDLSGSLFIQFAVFHRLGGARPVGGTQTLPNALAGALHQAGGTIRTDAVVETILVRNGRASGVRLTNGDEIAARRGVIATCDPRTALGKLLPPDTLEPEMRARVNYIPANADGWGIVRVDVALAGRLRLDRHQQYRRQHQRRDDLDLRWPALWLGGFDEVVAAYPQARAGDVPNQILLFSVIPTAADPSQAPEGMDTLYLYASPMPLTPNGSWDDAAKAVLARASQIYDGIEQLEVGRCLETPDDLARRVRTTNGSIYHTDVTPFRAGPLRPSLGLAGHRMPVDGYYLGGSGSHSSAAVSGIPGRLSAVELLRDDEKRRKSATRGKDNL